MDQPADMSQPVDVVQPIDDSPSAVDGQPADESQPIDIAQMMQPMDPAPALVAPPTAGQVLVAPADAAPGGMAQPVETDEPTGDEEQPAPILAGLPAHEFADERAAHR